MNSRVVSLVNVIVGVIATLAATALPAMAQAPSTDIFLLGVEGAEVRDPQRITDREGYDNQPKFLPDGKSIVYSSYRGDGTDIYRYDLSTQTHTLIVGTEQSEYSPTPIPGKKAISLVRDYGDGKQQLWSFPLQGGEPELLLPGVNPVGYHGWVDESRVLMFVLGEGDGSTATLQLAGVGSGAGRVLGTAPGRAIERIPGSREMAYVDKSGDDWWLTALNPDTGDKRRLIAMPEGREDCGWAPDGAVWTADDARLYRREPGMEEWQFVVDLDRHGIRGITRLTFSPDGKTLAVVGTRTPTDLADAYRTQAGQILGAALTDIEGWEKLLHLSTVIGHRLSGSKALERAIDWAAERMEAEGLVVRKQPVMVPHWVRGEESARVVSPSPRELRILGLGRSVGTPPGGITAPVVVVTSFEELEALGRERVEGKIVVYAVQWEGYDRTVAFRSRGASRAAALGAVAAMTRSATGHSLSTPHTGSMRYDEEQPKIPAAALTVEDSEWMRRMAAMGREVVVHLEMSARTLPDAQSYNVIVELPGTERPEEVVVMGGHYDSWDVGDGSHDDGAACIAAWQALRLIQQVGLRPRRTLRVVLWTNEENGARGGRKYRSALGDDEVERHVAAIEMDGGSERPVGFGLGMSGIDPNAEKKDPKYEAAFARLQQIGKLIEAIDAGRIMRGGAGADINPLMKSGVPGLELRTVEEHYFDWHHSAADTVDKVDLQDFRKAIALFGVAGYVLADMPERLVPVE
jgi:hypothetical protein